MKAVWNLSGGNLYKDQQIMMSVMPCCVSEVLKLIMPTVDTNSDILISPATVRYKYGIFISIIIVDSKQGIAVLYLSKSWKLLMCILHN